MKKITSLFIALLFTSVIAHSQNSCLDAIQITTTFISDSLSLPGSTTPPGPDFGCVTQTDRTVWFYMAVCEDVYLNSIQDQTLPFGGTHNDLGAVFYGPFSQKIADCNDLTASKIIACTQVLPTATAWMLMMNTTLLKGNYYYLVVTASDSFPLAYADFLITAPGWPQNCFECNNQVSIIKENNLCLVSVDTSINKCILTWEEFPNNNLAGYNVFRESTLTGVYDSLTTIPLGSPSTYTDLTSSPSQHNYTYKVSGVDSCGNTYGPQYSYALTSIHLISFAGGNNQANLIWNNVYTNNNFIPQYYIYRNNNGTGWQVIDSIGITLSTITYTDIFAPSGTNQYTVELRKLVPCVPMRTSSNPYQSVFSNTTITFVTGEESFADNSYIRIYPNPATDFISIYYNLSSAPQLTVDLFNMYGQKLNTLFAGQSNMGKQELRVSLKDYAAGIYFVKINADGQEQMRKVLKL